MPRGKKPLPHSEASADLEDFFENGTVALHLVGSDGTIQRANRAELELLGYSREEYIGHNILEFHADKQAIDDILTRLSAGEQIDRYPAKLRAKDGSIRDVEITSSAKFKGGKFLNTRCFTVDVTCLKQAQARVREHQRHLEKVLNSLPAAIYTTDASGKITYFNDVALKLAGQTPQIGTDEWCVTWRLWSPEGEVFSDENYPTAVALRENRPVRDTPSFAERPDGGLIPLLTSAIPLHGDNGELVCAINMLVDITEQKRREDQIEFVMHELSHRSKNLLAVIQAIANTSMGAASNLKEFKQKFIDRLHAISRSHDVLVEHQWLGADIREVIEVEIAAFLDGEKLMKISLSGESIVLSPSAAQTISLAVHELATNAVKHGAFSGEDGRVEVEWKSHDGIAVAFTWRELKKIKGQRPQRRGFGTQMLLNCFEQARFDFSSAGFQFSGLLPYARSRN